MDLAPAQTTHTGVRPSSVRSAETSSVASPPRCTPPMPPVTNTRTPARCASSIVHATVVAPSAPLATTPGRSRRETCGMGRQTRVSPAAGGRRRGRTAVALCALGFLRFLRALACSAP